MTPKVYSSFEEIDSQLKILKLKRTINKEHLKYNYNKAKYYLYPKNIIVEFTNALKERFMASLFEKYFWFL